MFQLIPRLHVPSGHVLPVRVCEREREREKTTTALLLCGTLPCNPSSETALQPLIRCGWGSLSIGGLLRRAFSLATGPRSPPSASPTTRTKKPPGTSRDSCWPGPPDEIFYLKKVRRLAESGDHERLGRWRISAGSALYRGISCTEMRTGARPAMEPQAGENRSSAGVFHAQNLDLRDFA